MSQYCRVVARKLRRLGVSPNDIEDATQRVFWVLAQKLDGVACGGECAYLHATALRIASEVRRVTARRARREVPLEDKAEAETRTEDLVDLKRARALLDGVVARMPAELATVFVLTEVEGLTVQELSQRIGIPAGTVASRLRRSRALFSQHARQIAGGR